MTYVYVGTYTNGGSEGIYIFGLDAATGALSPLGVAATEHPSFVVLHPSGRYLFSVNELQQGRATAFAVNPATGALTCLNTQDTGGAHPCHLTLNEAGTVLFAANYSSGSVTALPVGQDGVLGVATAVVRHSGHGPNAARQEGPHAHSVNLAPGGRVLYACDLGTDRVMHYVPGPALVPAEPAATAAVPGSGPRHMAFHPNGKYAYVVGELDCTVTVYAVDGESGALQQAETVSTLPAGQAPGPGDTGADIHVHPSGKFLYASNRGPGTLAVFSIDSATGRLALRGHQATGGQTPRGFNIDPSGRVLVAANQDNGLIRSFAIDPESGGLTPTGHEVEVPYAVCIQMLEA
jgi:6-phosphogluconolactonase